MIEIAKPKFLAKLSYDIEPINPRLNSGIGQMVCWSNKYNLGDKHSYETEKELFEQLMQKCSINADELNIDMNDFENQKDKIFDELKKHMVIIPLYLYDGKFPEMTTAKERSREQGEFVGYIFLEPEQIKELYGSNERDARADVIWDLCKEVGNYSHYISGNNYLLQIYKDNGELYSAHQYTGNLNDEMVDEMKKAAQNDLKGEKISTQEIDDMFGADAPQIVSDKSYGGAPQIESVEYEEMEM